MDRSRILRQLGRTRRTDLLNELEAAVSNGAASSSLPRYLDESDLRTLAHAGWEIGGHGASHDLLTTLDDQALDAELAASAQLLAGLGSPSPWTFAYPDGQVDERVAAAVRTSGFAAAVTVNALPLPTSPALHHLPRVLCRGDDRRPAAILDLSV